MSYIRVSLIGTLPGGEAWSVNPCYAESIDQGGWNQDTGQDAADAVAVLQLGTALNGLKSSAAAPSRVRVERRSDQGVLIGAAEANWAPGTTGQSSPIHPPQTALVFSLRTAVPGRSGRGRLYWPALGATLAAATLRLNAPAPQGIADAICAYLDLVGTTLKNNLHPTPSLVNCKLAVVSTTKKNHQLVNSIQIGNVLDTQRRRRDRLIEEYTTNVYPTPIP